MSYTALYRKWRPRVFGDVKGQDHIVTTLQNQIRSERIGHAYLFCGTRGTGKTSVAKIFAKAVNCEHPEDGSPCGECPSCQQIQAGTSLNVVEIDAASNNGVENIREIRDQVQYPPTEGKYRVYIIDEVHMLSTGAFNALLKTLEEPLGKTMIFLLTDRLESLKQTIRSRCGNMYLGETILLEKNNEISELVDMLREGKFFYKTKEVLFKCLKNYEDVYGLIQDIENDLRLRLYAGEDPDRLMREISAVIDTQDALRENISVGNAFGIMILKFGGFDD